MNAKINDRIVVVVSTQDQAGMNMLRHFMDTTEFQTTPFQAPVTWPEGEYILHKSTEFTVIQIPKSQIYTDYFKGYLNCDLLIFASKHSSAAGQKALLVHTTGNWGPERGHGGNDQELAIAPASILSHAYEKIKSLSDQRELDYWTGIECTHHGPTALDVPIMFVETGGTEKEWNDLEACRLIADVILETIRDILDEKIAERQAFVGIGGNHYCSRFIKVLDEGELGLGHVIPKHALEYLDENLIQQALDRTQGEDTLLLIDKKGAKSDHKKITIEFAEKNGILWKYV
ncbi:MAG: D-aminoacyl-tRNA deacylase [Candidatus Kariarchaeaceae archaeon]|jgi:D-aminoacyl-tRNA deacylase